jgi:ATP-binding cassette, subfamily C, type I secretion system permease/ATPase
MPISGTATGAAGLTRALRSLSLGLLACGFAVLGYDLLTGSSAPHASGLTSLGDAWTWLTSGHLSSGETLLGRVFDLVLALPLAAAFGALAVAVYAVYRSRRRARDGDDAQQGRRPSDGRRSELAAALAACRGAFIGIGLFSAMSNILMLTGSFFMLEVYDRVLPSRSLPTLAGLILLAGMLFSAQAVLDIIRSRLLVRIGTSLDEALSQRVFEVVARLPLKGGQSTGLQPMRDLDGIRTFLSGNGPTAFFDLPWLPIYMGIIFAFHPLLGVVASIGAIVLVIVTLLTEFLLRGPVLAASRASVASNALAESSRRNAEVLTAMGLVGRMGAVWRTASLDYIASQQRVSDVAGGLGAASRTLRMMLQSGVLATGAYLVIQQQASAGIIIASSILSARALAPVDLAIANWRGFAAARQGWARLTKVLTLVPPQRAVTPLGTPSRALSVEAVSTVPPNVQKLVVQDISFELRAGQGLGIIGPSGSGKSSLARTLVGVWPPARGRVELDGASLDQWAPEALGEHIGYLPQDVELFAGSVAQNISRFDPDADPAAIIAAAKAADVHELIVNLRGGYDAQVGEQGAVLSAGQKQRVALARALYGDPFLVVLDEPNSNLDADGEQALTRAIDGVRQRGGIVVVVSHRPSAVAGIDGLLVMANGRAQALGPRDEILAKVARQSPLKVVPGTGRQSS